MLVVGGPRAPRYPLRVLAQGRHSSSIFAKPLVVIGGGVAAVVAIGLIVFVLVRGGGGLLPGGGGGGTPTDTVSISPLGWQVSAPFPVPTNLDAKAPESQQAADRAGQQVVDVLEDLYTFGFLDAGALTSGDYSATFDLFAGGARPEARRREAVLTAGPGADVFDRIEPTEGRVQMKVLLGANGQPVSVVGVVAFEAEAFGDEGGVRFVSRGQYFLEPVDGAWRIISFDVRRRDVELKESATPSASATPSGSASASGGGTR
jgi:hypothetical protein